MDEPTAARSVQRLRLACVALGLTLLTFSQSSGQEAADTKLDLVVAPARFLRNAVNMWDPTAAAGQLQDQAYGYLFPMGPFFLVGKLSALSPWVIQRSWESMLLVAAFLGVVRLARLLGVLGFWPRVGAGLAYALAPRVLMELGVISAELLPVVALPWILIPLVRGAVVGSPRRAAAWSGVALLFASGINASATLAIMPVPVLWLLTRSPGPRRRALASWWALAVALACLWWVVPLLVLGRYSPRFLDWIESSSVTTSRTSLLAVLRGADHWQAYLGPGEWPAGWILVAAPAAIVATTAVAALGVAGLGRRASPHRLFLLSSLVCGLVLVTLGHVASVGPPFAGSVRELLDGGLNAFRNVHKFDPVVRLPIAIGVGHALAAIGARAPQRSRLLLPGRPTIVHLRPLAILAVLGVAAVAIAPALAGRIVPHTRSVNEASWWRQTGAWLGKHEGGTGGRTLVVPGAATPVYIWGYTRDDALQPVADGPWTVRDAAPLTQPGYVRMLDTIEARLAAGRADPTLAPLLARAGIRYLVVRNDLVAATPGGTVRRFVHATVSDSPGFTQVAQFGPDLAASYDPNRLVDLGLTRGEGAIDIYENADWRGGLALLPARDVLVASGSSDALPTLVAAGLSARTPVVFGAVRTALRAAHVPVSRVVTDGVRRREFNFGSVNSYSPTMTAAQPYQAPRAAHDYLPADVGTLSSMTYTGIADVRASSAESPARAPWAALDGDPDTAWVGRTLHGAVGQWLQVSLRKPTHAAYVQIAFSEGQTDYPTRLRVTTDAGALDAEVSPDSNTQRIPLPAGATSRVKLTVLAMTGANRRSSVAITALAIPGILPSRTLSVPGAPQPDLLAFSVDTGRRSDCLTVSGAAACDRSWSAAGEEDAVLDRTVAVSTSADYRADAAVQAQAGPQLDALLDAGNPVRAIVSSTDSTDPRERAGAAVDGAARTGWVARAGDRLPSIELTTARAHRISGIVVRPIADSPAAAPSRLLITAGSLSYAADVPLDGRIGLPRSVRTDSVRIAVLTSRLRTSTDSLTDRTRLIPVGIGEIRLLGKNAPAGRAHGIVQVPCGQGPSLLLNGAEVRLAVTAAAGDLRGGLTVHATACGTATVRLLAGTNRLRLAANGLFRPASLTLRRVGAADPLGAVARTAEGAAAACIGLPPSATCSCPAPGRLCSRSPRTPTPAGRPRSTVTGSLPSPSTAGSRAGLSRPDRAALCS